jgi:hypothetical protein
VNAPVLTPEESWPGYVCEECGAWFNDIDGEAIGCKGDGTCPIVFAGDTSGGDE